MHLRKTAITITTLLVTALPFAVAGAQQVKVAGGVIQGTAGADPGIEVYKGVPYAAPPVGDLRWRDPQPVPPWPGVLKADHFSASCYQPAPIEFGPYTSEFVIPPSPVSEDCLYLNVWAPKDSAGKKLPVLFWIHGGGYSAGSGSIPIYDGESFAKRGVIFVTINYRLDPLGFLALPELTAESPHHSSGNYGLLDQLAALRWVHDNIGAFGGDSARVTIAGQSAGAGSVIGFLVSPLAKGLFDGAIVESTLGIAGGRPMKNMAEAEQFGSDYLKTKGVTTVAELRKMPADELLKGTGPAYAGLGFGRIQDGYFQTESTEAALSSGKFNDVPILAGYVTEDGSGNAPLTRAEYLANVNKDYGSDAQAFLKAYPADNDDEMKRSAKLSGHDKMTAAQLRIWARLSSDRKSNLYPYVFSKVAPWYPGEATPGAFHTSEVPYAYGNLHEWKQAWRPEDYKLSDLMVSYWTNFVKTGNPNGQGLPAWPAYSPKNEEIMNLGDTVGPIPFADIEGLKFFEAQYFKDKTKQ